MIINSAIDIPTLILMLSSSVADRADLSVSDRKRILSKASEALEINSLKKIYKFKIMYKLFNPWNNRFLQVHRCIHAEQCSERLVNIPTVEGGGISIKDLS